MKIKDSKTGKNVEAKLPKLFKTKWLKALRSGKFEQTTGTLFDGTGYCCLGVACKIAHPKLNLGKNQVIDFALGETKNVPDMLKGDAQENKLVGKLAMMNDGGKSFKFIASYIERYL